MGGFRLLLENFIKYGFLVNPMEWYYVLTGKHEGDASYPSVVLALCKLLKSMRILFYILIRF